MTVPVDRWRWHGVAAHFICGSYCRFHLATEVGPWLVSTVGEYYRSHEDEKPTTLGGSPDSFYETYIFHIGDAPERCTDATCNCELPTPTEWSEVEGERSATRGEAARQHMAACLKWSDVVPSADRLAKE